MDRRTSWSCPRVVKIFASLGSCIELAPTERKGRWFVDICRCFLSSIRAGYWCRMCCSCNNAEEYRSLRSSISLSGTRVSVELSTPVEEMRGRSSIGSNVESWTSSWLLTSPSLSSCWHSLTELFTSILFTAPFRRNCETKTSSECCWLCLWAEASGLLSLLWVWDIITVMFNGTQDKKEVVPSEPKVEAKKFSRNWRIQLIWAVL